MTWRVDLSGRTALVTGASSGLGAHFAGVLGRAGARVALVARNAERLAALEAELGAQGIEAAAFPADVTDRDSLERAIGAADGHFEGIDVLVANAGIARPQRFTEMSEDAWADVLDVNLGGVWRTGQIGARAMQARGRGGAIINVASVLGEVVQPTQANYATSKAGVLHLTRVMARELGRDGIRVNAIAPGYFETEINADFFASDAGRRLIERLFPRRLGDLAELDGPLLLLSSDAGSFMNGATLTVDGGARLAGV